MYYHAVGSGGTSEYQYQIGVTSAGDPLGPFKKHGLAPIIPVGPRGSWEQNSVACPMVLKQGDKKYVMWYGGHDEDYKWDMGLATATNPLGPWKKYEGNPVLTPGDWGAWDDGGYSEARVRYHEGVFHCVYGGTKTPKLESLGYAYSFDGYNWIKYGANPVVPLNRVPDGSGFAEVHCYIEGPYIYFSHITVLHRGRYCSGARQLPSLAYGRFF